MKENIKQSKANSPKPGNSLLHEANSPLSFPSGMIFTPPLYSPAELDLSSSPYQT